MIDAVDAGRPRTPRPASNQTTLPSSSISAPQASAHRATMPRPRPKVSSSRRPRRSCAGVGSSGGSGEPSRDLDARVLAGAAHPHRDRGLGVQQGVGDQLGDAQLGALDELGATDVTAQSRPPSGVRPARRGVPGPVTGLACSEARGSPTGVRSMDQTLVRIYPSLARRQTSSRRTSRTPCHDGSTPSPTPGRRLVNRRRYGGRMGVHRVRRHDETPPPRKGRHGRHADGAGHRQAPPGRRHRVRASAGCSAPRRCVAPTST